MTELLIPADLKPSDGRFGAGPSKVRPEQIAALAAPSFMGTSHRQKPVKSLVGRVRAGLSELFSLPDGYEVVLGNGGATAFWDIAAFGLVNDRAQFLSFGEFGSKFAKGVGAAPHLGIPTIHTSDPGDAPAFTAEQGVDTYATPQNETLNWRRNHASAGRQCRRRRTAAGGCHVCCWWSSHRHRTDGRLLLRAAEELRLRRWTVVRDHVPAAIERAAAIEASDRWIPDFLNLQTAIDNSRLDQTYNTLRSRRCSSWPSRLIGSMRTAA